MPAIGKNMASLAKKVHKQRMKSLVDNEKFIAKGFGTSDPNSDDDDSSDNEDKKAVEIEESK